MGTLFPYATLGRSRDRRAPGADGGLRAQEPLARHRAEPGDRLREGGGDREEGAGREPAGIGGRARGDGPPARGSGPAPVAGEPRTEEHTSELQSPLRISFGGFSLKKTQKNIR